MNHDSKPHDRVTIALHWITGGAIIALALIELFRHEFPKGHLLREGLKPIHQPAGTIIFGLILMRIAWRSFHAPHTEALRQTSFPDLAARLVHVALYALMLALPLLGIISILGSGKSIDFGLFQITMPLQDIVGPYAKPMRSLHETLALWILALAGIHASAALVHHYILRDGVMARMAIRANRPER